MTEEVFSSPQMTTRKRGCRETKLHVPPTNGISFDGNSRVTISFAKPYTGTVMVTPKRVILGADGASSEGGFSAIVV
jgi:hypothetical protein